MDHGYGQCSDPFAVWPNPGQVVDVPDCSSSVQSQRGSSDDEVILASSCPKKRAGRKKFKETRHPVFRGVRQRNGNRWVCEVRTPNNKSRIWLGTYPTPEMAARAHDVAALALRGRLACLNFADSAWRLPAPASTNTRDIQQAAAEAAEACRAQESSLGADHYDQVSTQMNGSDNVLDENAEYMDEEAVFDMPRLLANMAQGLLLPPPYSDFTRDDIDADCDVSLWSYSV